MQPLAKTPRIRNGKPIVSRYSPWIRFYLDVVDDPKCQRLDPYTFKAWINLLALAGRHPQGHLPAIEDIAFKLRMSSQDAQLQINILIDVGLIDILTRSSDAITLQPHNWEKRQFKSDSEVSTDRVRKHREKIAQDAVQRSGNVSETLTQHFDSASASDSAMREGLTSKNSVGETDSGDGVAALGRDGIGIEGEGSGDDASGSDRDDDGYDWETPL